jgi:hypothetical protein
MPSGENVAEAIKSLATVAEGMDRKKFGQLAGELAVAAWLAANDNARVRVFEIERPDPERN